MSRRSRREGAPPPSPPPPEAPAPGRQPGRLSFVAQVGVLLAVFAVTTLLAELAGAANLGVALGIGQICFAIALLWVILKT